MKLPETEEALAEAPQDGVAGKPTADRTFRIGNPEELPPGALRWTTSKEKGLIRKAWRFAMMHLFGGQGRAMRLAWCIEALSLKTGYAYASDPTLVAETGIDLDGVQKTLTFFEREGAIARIHVPHKGGLQRRIYLTRGVISRCPDTRQFDGYAPPVKSTGKHTRQIYGTEERECPKRRSRRNLNAAELAQADAERRDARARGEPVENWLDED